jgi:2-polyprenyl-6-methoxyphenol hydroxylase-like FAD-dependent oxidoreductase
MGSPATALCGGGRIKGPILIIGGGIGGLTSAIALRRKQFDVDIIEKDRSWSVYGVGIIQQSNVVRAMAELGVLDDYLTAGFGFDQLEIYIPSGVKVATIPAPKLTKDYPANVGIGRRALHKVLGERAIGAGARIRLGVTANSMQDDGESVKVRFSDDSTGEYAVVIGADGLYSDTRRTLFPGTPAPEFTGQAVWRYNFERPQNLVSLHVYDGPMGIGLVPLSKSEMYMYLTTPEPGNPRYPKAGLAAAMRAKLSGAPPTLAHLVGNITDDDAVVYRPLEWVFLTGDWHKGRVVLLGDAVHATTPHLGQGAGMAIEDSLVLAEELAKNDSAENAFTAFRNRRFERCKYIVERSKAVGDGQIGKGPLVDNAVASREMFQVISAPL